MNEITITIGWLLAGALAALAIWQMYKLQQASIRTERAANVAEDAARNTREWIKLHEDTKALYHKTDKRREAAEALNAQLSALNSTRSIAWAKPARRVAANDVRRAFAVAAEAPLWVALHQELDDYLQDQLDQVSLPPAASMTEEQRLHLAGGIEHLRLFQKRMLQLHAAAHKEDADLEGGEEKGGAE
jgi:hypothetical protein